MIKIPSTSFFKLTGILGLILLVLACGSNPDQMAGEEAEGSGVDSLQNSLAPMDWAGTYIGKLPCVDCEGIETELTITADSNYVLKSRYLGKGDGQSFITKGSFTWRDGQVIELLGETDGAFLYAIDEGTVTQLDPAGAKIVGDLAAGYVLTKMNP